MSSIYLDHNATTRPHPAVVEEMRACLEQAWGNPSSTHRQGQEARRVLDRARSRVAKLIGADPEEILFTSGGTEADNLAIRGAASLREGAILASAIEHSAVMKTCKALEADGRELRVLPVDGEGIVQLPAFENALHGPVALVAVMLSNNDLGTLQPVREITERAHEAGAIVHTDAVQAAGKVSIDVRTLGVDLLALSAHKLYGPKGVGALFVRRGLALPPLFHGGPQERRLRAGTENLPGIAGFGMACELAATELNRRAAHSLALREALEQGILAAIPGSRLHGHPQHRAPNTAMISFNGVMAEDLLLNLDLEGVSVSLGAACSSESRKPNPVLLAMGCPEAEAMSALRFSVGEDNDAAQIRRVLELLPPLVARLRARTR